MRDESYVGRIDLSDEKLPEDQKGRVFVQPRTDTTGGSKRPLVLFEARRIPDSGGEMN